MDHQGAPNVNFHHYTLKKLELAKNWPSSGPRLLRISTYDKYPNEVLNEDTSRTDNYGIEEMYPPPNKKNHQPEHI